MKKSVKVVNFKGGNMFNKQKGSFEVNGVVFQADEMFAGMYKDPGTEEPVLILSKSQSVIEYLMRREIGSCDVNKLAKVVLAHDSQISNKEFKPEHKETVVIPEHLRINMDVHDKTYRMGYHLDANLIDFQLNGD